MTAVCPIVVGPRPSSPHMRPHHPKALAHVALTCHAGGCTQGRTLPLNFRTGSATGCTNHKGVDSFLTIIIFKSYYSVSDDLELHFIRFVLDRRITLTYRRFRLILYGFCGLHCVKWDLYIGEFRGLLSQQASSTVLHLEAN
ncbi:hypothetical protein QVD17_16049 [Tagetes erecta]|uniref:Uncharacterized protein n=1 Tax=Tagetes erecta TaxID=13708 RepID=A0AAD8P099_TARER|nr:hypothetical protein QVD17_16049 [Tagetes erecta]